MGVFLLLVFPTVKKEGKAHPTEQLVCVLILDHNSPLIFTVTLYQYT